MDADNDRVFKHGLRDLGVAARQAGVTFPEGQDVLAQIFSTEQTLRELMQAARAGDITAQGRVETLNHQRSLLYAQYGDLVARHVDSTELPDAVRVLLSRVPAMAQIGAESGRHPPSQSSAEEKRPDVSPGQKTAAPNRHKLKVTGLAAILAIVAVVVAVGILSPGLRKSLVALGSPPSENDLCDEAMSPFVKGSVQVLQVVLGVGDYEQLLATYYVMRCDSIIAAAAALRPGGDFSGLTDAQLEVIVAANRRAQQQMADALAEPKDGQSAPDLAAALRFLAVQASLHDDSTAAIEAVLDNITKPNGADAKSDAARTSARAVTGGGLVSFNQLRLRKIVAIECTFRSALAVREFLGSRDSLPTGGNYRSLYRKIDSIVSPRIAAAMSAVKNRYGLETLSTRMLPEVTEAEKTKADVTIAASPGKTWKGDIPFTHESSIAAHSVGFNSEHSAPDFCVLTISFDGWDGSLVKFSAEAILQPNAPLGTYYFRLIHDGEISKASGTEPVRKERIVELVVQDGKAQ